MTSTSPFVRKQRFCTSFETPSWSAVTIVFGITRKTAAIPLRSFSALARKRAMPSISYAKSVSACSANSFLFRSGMMEKRSDSTSSLFSVPSCSSRPISPCLRRIGGSPTRMCRSDAPSLTRVRSSVSIACLAFSGFCASIFTLLREARGAGGASSGGSWIEAELIMPVRRAKSPLSSTTIDTFHFPSCSIARTENTPSAQS